MKINIITVTYGKRFEFLKQVLDSVLKDKFTNKVILVDNNSDNKEEIDTYINKNNTSENKKEIILVRHKENTGSAGGFSSGIEEARKHLSDYVLLLDDDNVPEEDWGELLKSNLNILSNKEKIILSTNRFNAVGNNNDFKDPFLYRENPLKFSLFKNKKKQKTKYIIPIIPCSLSSYGGTLIPFRAILETDLPDRSFYLYFDDFEYFLRMKNLGYIFYSCYKPKIKDIDSSFIYKNNTSASLFGGNMNKDKIYYYSKNRAKLRIITKSQSKIFIWFYSLLWVVYQSCKGVFYSKNFFSWYTTTKILIKSTIDGLL